MLDEARLLRGSFCFISGDSAVGSLFLRACRGIVIPAAVSLSLFMTISSGVANTAVLPFPKDGCWKRTHNIRVSIHEVMNIVGV